MLSCIKFYTRAKVFKSSVRVSTLSFADLSCLFPDLLPPNEMSKLLINVEINPANGCKSRGSLAFVSLSTGAVRARSLIRNANYAICPSKTLRSISNTNARYARRDLTSQYSFAEETLYNLAPWFTIDVSALLSFNLESARAVAYITLSALL